MSQVFLSYKKEDSAVAALFDRALQAKGYSVFWDDKLRPDGAWDRQLEDKLASALCVVVLWTPRSVESEWVRAEAEFAKNQAKLLPVMAESCNVPLSFSLTQTLDLVGWDGDLDHPAFRKLASWIGEIAQGQLSRPEDTGGDPAEISAANRGVLGTLPSGESVWDGMTISSRTPPGTAFADGPDLPFLRILPAGNFLLGADASDPDRRSEEGPQKRIDIAAPFGLGIFPVTQAQFTVFSDDAAPGKASKPRRSWFGFGKPKSRRSSRSGAAASGGSPVLPVSGLTVPQAEAFCQALSARTGQNYRLPTEAEWEYACRAGTRTPYAFGASLSPDQACFRASATGLDGPQPIGTYPPNPFGLYDMHGNVREWTLDRWHDNYADTPADATPARSGHSAMNVVRGGCWQDLPAALRSAARGRATASVGNPTIGFRIVRELT